jgi:tetratricopeptide (TPR) repeat protein
MKAYGLVLILIALTTMAGCSPRGTSAEHYEHGRQLAEQSRTADAMREYLLAVETDDDSHFTTMAVSELGRLSMNQHDLQQARHYYEQAWQMADSQHDTTLMILTQRDMGRCSRAEGNSEEALRHFAKADSLLTNAQADTLRANVYPEYISLLLGEGRADEARHLVRLLPVDRRSGPSCLVAGKFYAELGQRDSAIYYFRRCMETDNVASRTSAAMYLSELASDDANWEQACSYALECAALVDSAKLQMQQENANLISSLTNQLDVERENYHLYRIIALIVVLVILLTAAGVIFVRERIARLKWQQEEQRQARVNHARSQQEQLIETFRNTPLYRKILVEESVNNDQWEDLVQLLNHEANNFVDKLTAFYPAIKPQEMQVCQLLKLEFTNQQIATILCRTQQAITNLRKRLYQKMFGKEGSADDLNQFLRLFPQE